MVDLFTPWRVTSNESLVRHSREVVRASLELLERTAGPIARAAAAQRRAQAAESAPRSDALHQSDVDVPPSGSKPQGQRHLG